MIDVGTPLTLDVTGPLAGLQKIADADAELRQQQLQTNQAVNQSFASVASSVGQYGRQLSSVIVETQRGAAAQQQFARDIGNLVKEIRDQGAAQREAQRISQAAAAERRKASQEAREAAKAEKAALREVAEAEKQVAAAAKLAGKEAAAAAKEASKVASSTNGVGDALGGLEGKVAAAFSIATVKAFASKVIEAGQATEATLSKLTFANGGDTQAAARDLAFLRAEADRLGLELNTTGKSYGSFVSAAAAGNFPLAEARKLFLATAGASATLKLSADDTQGVLLALTQILSKGTVSAEELRGQIGERLPGAFSIAARSIGVTEQQLNKLLQTGQLKSADFLPKFAEELQKTFGDGTAQAADSFTANLNRIENEFTAFFLRFQGTASKGVSTITGLFRRLNEGLDLRSVDGRQRLGEQRAQQGIQDYEATLNALLVQAEAQAKANNQAAGQASLILLARQRGALKEELAAAQIEAKRIEELSPSRQLLFPGGRDALREASVQAQQRVALLQGEIAKTVELSEARKKANDPKDLDGLIKRQEDLIKALKVRQSAATQENQGGGKDFLLGKGGLDEQLKEAQKELDRLLGKIDKAGRAAADKLAAALRALEQERATLLSLAAKAAIKDSDDQAERARLNYEEQLRQAEVIKQKLIEREAAVRKAGGRGNNADGVIDGVQDAELAKLRVAALDAYYLELGKIARAREQRLFDLRAETDAKEIEAVNRTYDAKLAAQKLGQSRQLDALDEAAGIIVDRARKQSQEEIEIEEARQRTLLALRATQEQRRIEQAAALGNANANRIGQTFGAGTGVSKFEAARTEAQQLLDIEKKAAEDSLNNTLNKTGKAAEIERAALEAQLVRVAQQQKRLDIQQTLSNFSIYKLILGENDSEETRAALDKVAGQVVQSLGEIVNAEEQAAAARASTATQNINELTGQLAAQIQLNEQGSASNIKGLQDQIAAEKAIRREALADQREAAKQKVIIDTLAQASSIATAAAEVFATFAAIPFIGIPLGIAAAGVLVGAFAASKIAAFQAASQVGQGFFKGGYTGGNDAREERGVVHGKEFVHTAEVTSQYRQSLFEPLHAGRPQDINWKAPELAALLPDFGLPAKMREERAAAQRLEVQHSFTPMAAKFDVLHDRLAAIEGSNQAMAEQPTVTPVGTGYLIRWPNGNTKLVKVGS